MQTPLERKSAYLPSECGTIVNYQTFEAFSQLKKIRLRRKMQTPPWPKKIIRAKIQKNGGTNNMTKARRILVIGDSFVEGVGGKNTSGWAHAVAAKLSGHVVEISGEGGDDTVKLLARWPKGVYNIVIIQIGTNDSRFRPSRGGPEVAPDKFKANLKKILDASKKINNASYIIVVGLFFVDEALTVPYKEDKVYKNVSIRRYDDIIKKVAKKKGTIYIAISDIATDASLLYDGLHPSDRGHALISARVQDVMERLLQGN